MVAHALTTPSGASEVTGALALRLAGDPSDLFSQMALWGLAAICEDAGLAGVRGSWTREATPAPVLWAAPGTTAADVAQAVVDHAAVRAAEGSWLHAAFALDRGSAVATLAPRTASPATPEEWRRLDAEVAQLTDQLPSCLDEEFLAGIGVRSWWVVEGPAMRPDRGCSLWEMRTRNRGADLLHDRLLPLATEVASWSADKVLAGLTGEATDDVVGKNSLDSRSSTGFRLPGPVDNARAWCALWGLALLPVVPLLAEGARTPAVARRRQATNTDLHQLLMVVPAAPMPVGRFTRLQSSRQLVMCGEDAGDEVVARSAAAAWLRERGATRLMRFPVRYVGSQSAPERQALAGEVIPT